MFDRESALGEKNNLEIYSNLFFQPSAISAFRHKRRAFACIVRIDVVGAERNVARGHATPVENDKVCDRGAPLLRLGRCLRPSLNNTISRLRNRRYKIFNPRKPAAGHFVRLLVLSLAHAFCKEAPNLPSFFLCCHHFVMLSFLCARKGKGNGQQVRGARFAGIHAG